MTRGVGLPAMRDRLGRWTPAAGIAFVLLILVSEVMKGDSPSPTGPADEIVSYLEEHRSGILAGAYVQMLALFLLAVVALALLERLWAAERRREAALAALGTVLLIVSYTAYVFFTAALAFGAGPDAGPQTAKALWEIRFVAETFISFPTALLTGSVAAGALRESRLPRWYGWSSAAVALAFLVGGADLARNGFFAPDGGYGFLLFWLLPLWVALTGFVVRERDRGCQVLHCHNATGRCRTDHSAREQELLRGSTSYRGRDPVSMQDLTPRLQLGVALRGHRSEA